MAIDVYLQIEGVKGESRDSAHPGWIECTEVHWSVVQPRSTTASSAGGHTAERAELKDVVFGKISDLASPILLQTCAMGKTIPKAKFEFMRADGNGKPIKYFEIYLENVLISGVAPSLTAGTTLSEHVSLKYSKIKWAYTQQNIAGGTSGSTVGGWDLAANKIAA
jgi:type VI secretion system secreted protein Hcp